MSCEGLSPTKYENIAYYKVSIIKTALQVQINRPPSETEFKLQK